MDRLVAVTVADRPVRVVVQAAEATHTPAVEVQAVVLQEQPVHVHPVVVLPLPRESAQAHQAVGERVPQAVVVQVVQVLHVRLVEPEVLAEATAAPVAALGESVQALAVLPAQVVAALELADRDAVFERVLRVQLVPTDQLVAKPILIP